MYQKRSFLFVCLCAFAAVFLSAEYNNGVSAQQRRDKVTPKETRTGSEGDREMAAFIRELTEGRTRKLDSDAYRKRHSYLLDGGFNLMLARIGSDGEALSACVTSIGEANSFWQRS